MCSDKHGVLSTTLVFVGLTISMEFCNKVRFAILAVITTLQMSKCRSSEDFKLYIQLRFLPKYPPVMLLRTMIKDITRLNTNIDRENAIKKVKYSKNKAPIMDFPSMSKHKSPIPSIRAVV